MKCMIKWPGPASRLRIAAAAWIGAMALACPACNTARGVGEDVEDAGEGLQDIAEDTKDAISD